MADRPHVPCLAYYPWIIVRVKCDLCPNRHGVYRLARLAAKYGSETPIADMLAGIASDCLYPRPNPGPGARKLQKYSARCHAYFPDIANPPPKPPDLPAAMMRPRLIEGGQG
ncbi:hypothetical protein MMMDOFMJ_4719 [Methylobacterium gnaphalii]|uniref:Uncharacterized protein n=1 Tax=Methylobacterium gnaphalii TaxID=1010610 RepID=A0A512JRB0_9HYPH|nr:hypothetical protein MGN01_42680 [Methylobacterium gnaphalii]GJD71754.1 hypothetical protein MMMDOFMJ_4719 [Methylobacterium gnaphalii]GLS48851.1 hypothetical protein GCM10007885_16980 [Methylobacterium gnaphalii]